MALIFCGWLGDRLKNRILVSMGGLSTALLGMILIVALPLSNNSGRLAGYYLTQASPTPFVALLSLISTNVAGYTKKTTVAACYLIGYCVGNVSHPTRASDQFWKPDHPQWTKHVRVHIEILDSRSSVQLLLTLLAGT